MRKALYAVLWLVFLAIVVYAIHPAYVTVGGSQVILKESRARVFIQNFIGDWLHYGRCEITGLSFYWTHSTPLSYSPNRGVIFSSYATDVLMHMEDKQRACYIAQKAFDRMQIKWHGESQSKDYEKLYCPLRTL